MKLFSTIVNGISQQLDKAAGICITGVMLIVVANVLLRAIMNRPILGAYEIASLLTAVGIALALANCAIKNGHIGVDFIIQRFGKKHQVLIDSIMNFISLIFWGFCAYHLAGYAKSMVQSGTVSSTAQIPVYPIIYLIALGLISLSLVITLKWLETLEKVFAEISFRRLLLPRAFEGSTRKAVR